MSEQTKDGGPAFPDPGRAQSVKQREILGGEGMTLRDYFAAKAMQGFCANQAHAVLDGPDNFVDGAKEAYAMADAMLAAREVE